MTFDENDLRLRSHGRHAFERGIDGTMKTLTASVLAVVLSGCGGWHHARGGCAQAAIQPPAPQVIVVTVPPGSTVVTPSAPAH